jgi:flagella basal body P-ring formation protein FlgA
LLTASALGATPTDTVPASLVGQARMLVAQQWQVAPDRVRLAWGRLPVLGPADTNLVMRLAGWGSEGWFAAILERPGMSPRAVRIRAGLDDSLPVATRALRAGDHLSAEDVTIALQTRWGKLMPPAPRDVEGWEVRRPLAIGEPLVAPFVAPPKMIATGDSLRLSWQQGTITIETVGIALNQARLGDPIRAKVGQTELSGIVTGPGTARMQPRIR